MMYIDFSIPQPFLNLKFSIVPKPYSLALFMVMKILWK